MLPRGRRSEPVTLEEVRAFKRVADRLATACRARGTQARMLERARDAQPCAPRRRTSRSRSSSTIATLDAPARRARRRRASRVRRPSASTRRRRATCSRRSSGARRPARRSSSSRRAAPIRCRTSRARTSPGSARRRRSSSSTRRAFASTTSARWTDPSALAAGARAPRDAGAPRRRRAPGRHPAPRRACVQREARALGAARPARRAAGAHDRSPRPDEPRRRRAGSIPRSRFASATRSRRPIALPRLRDRPEDLRAILTDRLAREGLRVRGRPVGIDHAGYARLVDYEFPGEDAELTRSPSASSLAARAMSCARPTSTGSALADEPEPPERSAIGVM